MSTGVLRSKSARLRTPAASGVKRIDIRAVFQTPVPRFHVVFPEPSIRKKNPELFVMHRAANRVYRSRIEIYKKKGLDLSPAELVEFIRSDVVGRMLTTERRGWGPFKIPVYVHLTEVRLSPWLASHRERAEGLLEEFKKTYRAKKERVSIYANNQRWGPTASQQSDA